MIMDVLIIIIHFFTTRSKYFVFHKPRKKEDNHDNGCPYHDYPLLLFRKRLAL